MQDAPKQPDPNLSDLDNAPLSVPPTAADVTVSASDYAEALARVTEDNASLREQLNDATQKLKTKTILDDMIKPSANKAFNYMFAYTGGVALILLMNGFGCFKNPLSPDVLQVLVGSTAATVIGLVGMVLTGVFIGARK